MFPRSLPRAAVRRTIQKERIRRELSIKEAEPEKASLKGKFFKMSLIFLTQVFFQICL